MYMAKKIRMQHLLHITLFRNNFESFERKIDPRGKNLLNLTTYLIVRIKSFPMNVHAINSYATSSSHPTKQRRKNRSKER